ncbi:hypothetical protein QR680_010074 [Steinernema hermaphroditum]|uniref:Uncharacterized protein n=1 Tax=Steinernema hermaphroditum TaxID=289476 RepID=A0AA39MA09_9BILA|nr:hypothetical protein QR680_010074 [Steinernema hermaphroditum]
MLREIFTSALVLVFACGALGHDEPVPNQSVAHDPNAVLVFFGTRHGNRNPGKFIEQNPRTWGQEGDTELTKYGKRQAYGLGKELRKFVDKLVNDNYVPKEAKFYSSSANRCQMTLQAALAGFYPPKSYADWSEIDWTPVPYTIDDPMLRMYAVSPCPASDAGWQPITDDNLDDLVKLTEQKKPILDYIAKNTGWNASISNAADLADNIIELDLYGANYPNWLERPSLKGYNKESLKKDIMAFAENHQIKCAEYGPCRDMMAGYWLNNVIENLQKLLDGKNNLKIIGYASHTEVTLALMKVMHIVKHEITTSAGFVIEVRKNGGKYQLRLLNHDPNPVDPHVIYQAKYTDELKKLSKDGVWVDVQDFINLVKPKAYSDWKSQCGIETVKPAGLQHAAIACPPFPSVQLPLLGSAVPLANKLVPSLPSLGAAAPGVHPY